MITIHRTEPSPAEARHRVPDRVWRAWSARLQVIRRCMHCKRVYRNAGVAMRCESYHESEAS